MATGTIQTANDSGLIELTADCKYRKVGRMVTVQFYSDTTSLSANTWKTLGTLPSGFRPINELFAALGCGSRYCQYLGSAYISTSGEVQVVCTSSVTNWSGSVSFFV